MDWNKTKTIFIIVFSILNIFLYWLYLDRQMDVDNMQVIPKMSLEDALELEEVTYNPVPFMKKEVSYLSAHIASFSEEDLKSLSSQSFVLIENSRLLSHMKKQISIKDEKGEFEFDDFLLKYVLKGNSYVLWEVDEENQRATFFQRVKNETIFHSPNAMLVIHWDGDENVTHYEQSMLDDFVSFNHKKDLLSPDDAVGSLVTRGYLKQGSTVMQVKSGYSILVQLTETQVFAPTWNIQVKLRDGTIENYFINAIEGKFIEFQPNMLEEQTE
ncbi:two-component system regulatory protein YycI [Sporosarcina sp. GW1-11]|uniref:two-component system regulatory protein YycI n=1 Tax=Sporosarcina sp. GW1-11 TaxID=2899126 RepID=UPI00294BAA4C|nr:two-component system regulatory protein YycI [Sporosarcina sp. GW1-11]MDV6378802.1 two-component system regulatory protein YycI [Sporosarcina sp. GW1-11]